MKKHIETLSDWIESREVRGYYTFTKEDIEKQFPTFTKEDIEKQFPSAGKVYIKTALYRLAAKAKIVSPWRNFYVIMPVEYSLKGVIPPVFYMDQLMSYLGKRYYVALLNAASFYGASHQRVQTFSLMVEQPSPHGGTTEHEEYFKERNIHIVLFQEENKYGICKEAQDADRLYQCFLS